MTTVEALRKARDLIAEEDRWCRGVSARDRNGDFCPADADRAHSRCLSGAVYAATGDNDTRSKCITLLLGARADVLLLPEDARVSIGRFNDQSTHAQVLKVLDRAILHAEPF